MSNPYASPSPSSDGEDFNRAGPPTKPLRVWIFQGLLMLQLIGAVAATLSALSSAEVRGLPLAALVSGLSRAIVGIPVVAGLLLALQRLIPRPSVVVPVLASLWWV